MMSRPIKAKELATHARVRHRQAREEVEVFKTSTYKARTHLQEGVAVLMHDGKKVTLCKLVAVKHDALMTAQCPAGLFHAVHYPCDEEFRQLFIQSDDYPSVVMTGSAGTKAFQGYR